MKHHGSFQTAAECCGGLQKRGLDSLRRWRNLAGTKIPCCLGGPSNFEKKKNTRSGIVMARTSGSTARATCTVHMCELELAMSHRSLHPSDQQRRAGPGWRLMMDNATCRMNLRINLKNSGECWKLDSPQSWRDKKHSQMKRAVFAPWCEVCVKAKGTGAQHGRQTNKELAKQEQYGPRIYSDFFYMSEEGVSTPMLREDGCHSFGTERIDAVRSEILCRLHSANWSSNVHQQE